MNLYKFNTIYGEHYINLDNVTHFVVESDVVRVWFDKSTFKDDAIELEKTTELLARLGIAIELDEPKPEPKPKKIKGEFKRTKIN